MTEPLRLKGTGLPERAVREIENWATQLASELRSAVFSESQVSRRTLTNLASQLTTSFGALVRGFALPSVEGADSQVESLSTETGTVQSVDATSSASGFGLVASPSPIIGVGTITFSISNAGNARTSLGLGSIATQAANNVAITGGSISGITDLAVADGGSGASTAASARTNFGIDDIATKKSKLNATIAPTVNDDSSASYAIGSVWVDVTADDVYMATDVSVGAALWKKLSP